MSRIVGVLGSGSFGTAIARILSKNTDVLIYCRRQEVADRINQEGKIKEYTLHKRVKATTDLSEIGKKCHLIFPILPSEHFREVIKQLAPFVGPGHLMIHGTKGLDVSDEFESATDIATIKRTVFTMSEVIMQETSVIRTGALAGPNLAKEILQGQPAATVIASEFDEIIQLGRQVLASANFIVYGSYNLKGIELAGALKNIIAIASGILNGMGFGKNMEALLITRGLREMIHIAQAVGAEIRPFLGTAGVGDLIATATSTQSRNYTFGGYIGAGKSVAEIKELMDEVAEGYRTINFANRIVKAANITAPITDTLYKVTYEGHSVQKALLKLVTNPSEIDVDFI
ncbi:MAG: NAD(P)-dependent glycerol-3-phosphate dehydrogenase [Saprospiraceae bacterium]|nr:NAD(P)-dependent glycerol-3-phosphate dehydrogenase [Bacteroidia bacterium]NNE15301.1 NAD(P)-dependent glycerol-3-phosphate dehydrogenase [Saprospiraceae bacterium]NNL91567.1 NAD(P)-dependent glycerol-3-phosphate dehydrogenase [Saprospiraceae bacterium]